MGLNWQGPGGPVPPQKSQGHHRAKQTQLEPCAQRRKVFKRSVPKAKTRLRISEGDLIREDWQQDCTRECQAGSREKLPYAHPQGLPCNGPSRIPGTRTRERSGSFCCQSSKPLKGRLNLSHAYCPVTYTPTFNRDQWEVKHRFSHRPLSPAYCCAVQP